MLRWLPRKSWPSEIGHRPHVCAVADRADRIPIRRRWSVSCQISERGKETGKTRGTGTNYRQSRKMSLGVRAHSFLKPIGPAVDRASFENTAGGGSLPFNVSNRV